MADTIGKNTLASAELRAFVDRLEHNDEQKKALSEDRKLIFAEANAKGFSRAGINYVLKARKMKPHDRQEAESVRDMYMHAMGMDNEPPLFRQLAALAHESVAAEKLLDAFKLFVPPDGEVILTVAGKKLRIWRGKDGEPQSEDYIDPEQRPASSRVGIPAPVKKDVPTCSADEAEAMGEAAGRDNQPVIVNPFPYGDERRARWDTGWRKGSGNDGMGPDD